jgi:predicted TIM-barrel fold metal-dependent hydrolase
MTGEPIDCRPAFRDPAARLELLDDQGVHRALMFPTLANLVEHELRDDPELTVAVIHALNQWMHEEWTFNYRDRIFPTPVITLPLLEAAMDELDFVLERGARVVLIRPAPVKGFRGWRSFALPEFDPFWAKVEAAGIAVCFHASFPPLTEYVAMWEPQATDNAFKASPFKVVALGHREVEDAIASMICHGTLTRFPNLRIASVENGADWVGHLLASLDRVHGQMPQEFKEHPVDVFRRNVYISPFWEQDIAGLIDLVGVDRVLFGSDYPHPEGIGEPLDYLDSLKSFDDDVVRKVMSENGHRLLALTAA